MGYTFERLIHTPAFRAKVTSPLFRDHQSARHRHHHHPYQQRPPIVVSYRWRREGSNMAGPN